ncbi:MAG: glycine--tRNA ligase subunit beta [Pelagibacterales bacterium]|nr:glycine--tRNA ligase subunit beta [Pelagibacterales bacterium]
MSEFFLELFSEEIPANLQKNARENLLQNFKDFFEKKNISFSKNLSFSTPNRLLILFEGIKPEIKQKEEEIRGPKIDAPEKALDGFLRSNNFQKKDLYQKDNDKGTFYFVKKPPKTIKISELLNENIPSILDGISWKKSMKWGDFQLYWARPLKSILAIFNNKNLLFKYHHLQSSNLTFVDKDFEDKKKSFNNFKLYIDYFKKSQIVIDQNKRKKFIELELLKKSKRKNLTIEISDKLLNEVTDLVNKPNILACKFDDKFLQIPKEILITTMQFHQKYFHTFDNKGNITNNFLVVANNKDNKGFIKSGNERVVNARLSDAQFFWEKNKSNNLVKQVSKLKLINYFKGLGTYFDKIQRMRKLGGMISDELLISKEKVEMSATICKVDLLSDIVGEFPELQGIMGSYFAEFQGFDKEISLAIREQYLPAGINSKTPKKLFSIALSLTDKLDTLVGFFGIDQKPTSSKDPFALRRLALGVIRLLLENKKEFKLKDLINYSSNLYQEQGFGLSNKTFHKDLTNFLIERLKNYMKENNIRSDIIEATINSYGIDNMVKAYNKALILNKLINQEIGQALVISYKRASNILDHELKNQELELSNAVDPVLFKNDFEKNLYKKINDLRKYFTSINKDENYELSLSNLAESKSIIFEFFDNVIVNDEDKIIQKNRLELLQMLCKTFDSYLNFSTIEVSK